MGEFLMWACPPALPFCVLDSHHQLRPLVYLHVTLVSAVYFQELPMFVISFILSKLYNLLVSVCICVHLCGFWRVSWARKSSMALFTHLRFGIIIWALWLSSLWPLLQEARPAP